MDPFKKFSCFPEIRKQWKVAAFSTLNLVNYKMASFFSQLFWENFVYLTKIFSFSVKVFSFLEILKMSLSCFALLKVASKKKTKTCEARTCKNQTRFSPQIFYKHLCSKFDEIGPRSTLVYTTRLLILKITCSKLDK